MAIIHHLRLHFWGCDLENDPSFLVWYHRNMICLGVVGIDCIGVARFLPNLMLPMDFEAI